MQQPARGCAELAAANAPIANLLAGLSSDSDSHAGAARKPLPALDTDPATEEEQIAEIVERAMLGDFDEPILSSDELDAYNTAPAAAAPPPPRAAPAASVAATCGSVVSGAPTARPPSRLSAATTATVAPAVAAQPPAAAVEAAQPPVGGAVPVWVAAAQARPEVATAQDLHKKLAVATALDSGDSRRPLWLAAVAITATHKGLAAVQGANRSFLWCLLSRTCVAAPHEPVHGQLCVLQWRHGISAGLASSVSSSSKATQTRTVHEAKCTGLFCVAWPCSVACGWHPS